MKDDSDPECKGAVMVFRKKGGSTAEMSSRAKEIGQELTESIDHLKQAAIVAREAFTPAVGTRVEAARGAVKPTWEAMVASLAPVIAAASEAQETGRKAAKKSGRQLRSATKDAKRQVTGGRRRRWPWVVGGALVIGGAAGVATALMRKRTSRSEWEEYGSGQSRSTTGTIKSKAGQVQEKVSETAGAIKDKVSSATSSFGDSTKGHAEQSGDAARRSMDAASGVGTRPSPTGSLGQSTSSGNFSRPN
jgi:hypothetical protein